MNRRQLLGFALGPAPLALLSSCTVETTRASVKPKEKRNKAPEFELKDGSGATVKLADYRGKVVLLNFWATWCGPCKVEIPWFIDFEQRFKSKGFAVLGIAMDEEGWEIVKPYLAEKKVNYRVVIGNDTTANLYGGVESLPTSFILDREGRIARVHIGLVSKKEYENDITTLLADRAGRA
jgi:peroxiredoxin